MARGDSNIEQPTIEDLEKRIAELKLRIPPHSVPPAMLVEIEELEEQLEAARWGEKEV